MDLYELKEHAQTFFGIEASVELDERCRHQIEVQATDGKYMSTAFVVFRHAKIVRPDLAPVYVPISPHRETIPLVDVASHIASAPSYALPNGVVENLRLAQYKGEEIETPVAQWARLCKMTEKDVMARIESVPIHKVKPVEDLVAELVALKRKKKGGYQTVRDEWLAHHPDVSAAKLDDLVDKFKEEGK